VQTGFTRAVNADLAVILEPEHPRVRLQFADPITVRMAQRPAGRILLTMRPSIRIRMEVAE
jgi:hypothetical protein